MGICCYAFDALNPLSIHVTFTAIVPGEAKMCLRLIAETDARSVGDSHPSCWFHTCISQSVIAAESYDQSESVRWSHVAVGCTSGTVINISAPLFHFMHCNAHFDALALPSCWACWYAWMTCTSFWWTYMSYQLITSKVMIAVLTGRQKYVSAQPTGTTNE